MSEQHDQSSFTYCTIPLMNDEGELDHEAVKDAARSYLEYLRSKTLPCQICCSRPPTRVHYVLVSLTPPVQKHAYLHVFVGACAYCESIRNEDQMERILGKMSKEAVERFKAGSPEWN